MVRALVVVGVSLLLVGAGLVVATHEPLEAAGRLEGLGPGQAVVVEDFGERGSLVLRYRHDEETVYAFGLRNRGPIGVTVTAMEPALDPLALLEPLEVRLFPPGADRRLDASEPFAPFTLAPGEERTALVVARFGSCEYYTERALDLHDTHRVGFRLLGVPMIQEVAYPMEVVVRSPTIVNCPDREMDRTSHRRTSPSPDPEG